MIVGLTGGIGSGKSVVATQLREMGYEVYDTDKEAKRLIVENTSIRQKIIALLGAEAYKDNLYQTAYVAQKVFADKNLLMKLNAIVHPAIRQDILLWSSRRGELLFIECAILFQAGIDLLCNKVVGITAPEDIRLERTIIRDNTNIDNVRARMAVQDIEGDLKRCDIVINNDGTKSIKDLCKEIIKTLSS
jgi:dephospho-CoA kinase